LDEKAWLRCDKRPDQMLAFVRKRLKSRKMRLAACGIVRLVWHTLTGPRTREAVEASEQFADGLVTREQLEQARVAAARSEEPGAWVGENAASVSDFRAARSAVNNAIGMLTRNDQAIARMMSARACNVLREVFGNPHRRRLPVAAAVLAWNDGTIPGLAQDVYEHRLPDGLFAPGRLAVLADALEDAGYTDAELLGHMRGPGPHVRGCWAVDLLLAKK
jgi:hypothetical protein